MFQVGDVVRLKSGGPSMTVTYLGERGSVSCEWFPDIDAAPLHHGFPANALMSVEVLDGQD
ncbi:YodC family protein [Comamonas sp. GB3 AK4-5]|uniref:YodC family protein n=1 Tax=Comamonas sp. GB3 AK4-5 TaxID=3231487 RepID=UPI00351EEE3E